MVFHLVNHWDNFRVTGQKFLEMADIIIGDSYGTSLS